MNLITAKTAGPMSLVLFGLLCATAHGQSPLITGNNASCLSPFGKPGAIGTTDFPTGPTVHFVPDGAKIDCSNGRGVLVLGNRLYYTELVGGHPAPQFGPTDKIRVAPFNGGAGGPDIGALGNPRPGCGVQDLAYHDGFIYALTGYPGTPLLPCPSLQVFKIAVGGGSWIGPVTISGSDPTADGFTILVNNGVLTFLINDFDKSCTYREYNSTTGSPTGKGFNVVGFGGCTGVDTSDSDTDGTHVLYFSVGPGGIPSQLYSATLTPSFTLSGPSATQTPGDTWSISDGVEDISLVHGFAGTPGSANCHGKTVSELAQRYGGWIMRHLPSGMRA